MTRNERTTYAWLAFLIGLAAILGAWGFQIIGGYVPCKLCLEERIPYYVGLPLILVATGFLLSHLPDGIGRVLLVLAGLAFLVGAGLGVYHAGAEWGFWPGPSDCGGGVSTTSDAGDLLKQISHTKVVDCTKAAWRFLGISFAGWNAIISFLVAILALAAGLRARDDYAAG